MKMRILPKLPAILAIVTALLTLTSQPARAAEPVTGNQDITFRLDKPGQVSAAVYNAQGQQLRTLLMGEHLDKGPHTLHWDGLDKYGQPAPAGTYEWRVLRTDGFEAKYVTSLATSADPSYSMWIGNHSAPSAVLWDGEQTIYLSAPAENTPQLISFSLDGKKVFWKQLQRIIAGSAWGLAYVDGRLFDLSSAEWEKVCKEVVVISDPATGEEKSRIDVYWEGDKGFPQLFLAVSPQRIVVGYPHRNALRWYGMDGKLQATASLNELRGIAMGPNDKVFAVSGGAIVTVTEAGVVTPLIAAESLHRPDALAFDKSRNELLVSEGNGSHVVKRFSVTDGKLLQTYGRAGGRKLGAFNPEDFLNITTVNFAPDGGLFVCEEVPRRMVWLDRQGHLVRQWLGPIPFGNQAAASNEDVTEAYYNNGEATIEGVKGEIINQARIDYATGQETLEAVYQAESRSPLGTLTFGIVEVTRREGVTYLLSRQDGVKIFAVDKAAGKLWPYARFDFENGGRAWSDRNGNHLIDADETSQVPVRKSGYLGGIYIGLDADWNIHFGFRNSSPPLAPFDKSAYVTIPNRAAATEPPRWDLAAATGAGVLPRDVNPLSHGTHARDVATDVDWNRYVFFSGEEGEHYLSWPTTGRNRSRLAKYDATGALQWSVGKDFSRGANPSGTMNTPIKILGLVNDSVVLGDRVWNPATVWTSDGLYAGYFLDRRANDGLPDDVYAWFIGAKGSMGLLPYDWIFGSSIAQGKDGTVVWFAVGNNNVPVYTIGGWDGWTRLKGTVKVAAPAPPAVAGGTGLSGEYFANDAFAGKPLVSQIDPQLFFTERNWWWAKDKFPWKNGPVPGIKSEDACTIRWSGTLEVPFTEDFWLRVYDSVHDAYGQKGAYWDGNVGTSVRLWLNDQLIIDEWPGGKGDGYGQSEPIRLQAGGRYAIRIEYRHAAGKRNEFGLTWGSRTVDWEMIPQTYLYPQPSAAVPVVSVRAEESQTAEEKKKPGVWVVTVAPPPPQRLTVHYTLGGSASAGDYQPLAGSVEIPAGKTSARIVLKPIDDRISEGLETVVLTLAPNPAYRSDGSDGSATITIADNDTVVTAGLIAYYPLDEDGPMSTRYQQFADMLGRLEGNLGYDRSGRGQNLHLATRRDMSGATPNWAPGRGVFGGALEFHGRTDDFYHRHQFQTGAAIEFPVSEFSVALWVKSSFPDGGLLEVKGAASGQRGNEAPTLFSLRYENGVPVTKGLAATELRGAAGSLGDGKWHHVVFVTDSAKREQRLYVDGVAQGAGAVNSTAGVAKWMRLGYCANTAHGDYLDGLLDEVRVYNRALSVEQVKTLARRKP